MAGGTAFATGAQVVTQVFHRLPIISHGSIIIVHRAEYYVQSPTDWQSFALAWFLNFMKLEMKS